MATQQTGLAPTAVLGRIGVRLAAQGHGGVRVVQDHAAASPRTRSPRVPHAGLHITVHAGEAAGPERAAVEHLGTERIGHGVRAAEDPRLLEELAGAG